MKFQKNKLYFGSNFKMYKNIQETEEYLTTFASQTFDIDRTLVQFFFLPSFTSLERASKCNDRNAFWLGAQNMSWADAGQFTGEISPSMLKELNLDLVLIGHSERRQLFGETNSIINKKIQKALTDGFRILLCIGETEKEKYFSIRTEVLRTQLKTALYKIDPVYASQILIAYEPVWSIGTQGIPAPVFYADSAHSSIKKCLSELFGPDGEKIPVLYGGSVNADNFISLITQPYIDGLFTTRTAFNLNKFIELIRHSLSACNIPKNF